MGGFPNGHFYSPVPDARSLHRRRDTIWRPRTSLPGIDLDAGRHQALLAEVQPFAAEYAYPALPPWPNDSPRFETQPSFFEENPFFAELDARMLFCLLRHFAPRKLIEVGGGYSTLLAADVNRRFMNQRTHITCIEPQPMAFLEKGTPPPAHRLIQKPAEDLPLEFFLELAASDILFIDSSHVVKTGNEVAFLVLEVLPRLAQGVIIHIHDIFFPNEYPQTWVLDEERAWNEQYLIRALLTFSRGFRVIFGCAFAASQMTEQVTEVFGRVCGGGSLWIEKVI